MYNIAICVTYFLEMLISYSFFSQLGEKKQKNIYCLIIGTLLFESGAVIDIFLSNIIWLNALSFAIINLIFALACYEIKVTKAIFYSILLDIFSTALEFASIFLISIVTGTDVYEYVDKIVFFILDVVISKILYFLTCLILSQFLNKDSGNVRFPIGLYFYPVVVVFSLLVFWNISATSEISNSQQLALSIISFALFLSIIILFIFYQNSIEKENRYMLLQSEFDKKKIEDNYYDILEKQNEELRIYAHDAKKHLLTIQEINANKEIDEYLKSMSRQLYAYSNVAHSGNHILDVVINKYVTECKIKNIDFFFDVKLANFNYIDNYDLVTILGNLLDNALEAAEQSKERKIKLETNHRNTYDIIVISNSCDSPPDKLLKTTKNNKKVHGLGLKSVVKSLKKYNGGMEWEYDKENKTYTTIITTLSK